MRKLSKKKGKYPDNLESFQAIWKFSRYTENFPDHLENIKTKISRPSGDIPNNLETFRTVPKLPSAISRVMRKNFPDDNAMML